MTLVGSSAAMSFFFCRGVGEIHFVYFDKELQTFPVLLWTKSPLQDLGWQSKVTYSYEYVHTSLEFVSLWLLTGTERGKSLIPISEHSFHIITELILLLIYLTRVKMEDLEHAALQENLASGWEFNSNHSRGGPPPPPPSLKMRCFPFRQLELDKDWAELGFAKTSGTVTRNRENRPFAIVGHVINFL